MLLGFDACDYSQPCTGAVTQLLFSGSTQAIRRIFFSESSTNIGGQELQLLAQAHALQALGVETMLLCKADSAITAAAAQRGIPARHLPLRNHLDLPSLGKLRGLYGKLRPDAVICHSSHDAFLAAMAAKMTSRRPVVLRARTYQHRRPRAWAYNHLFDRTLVPSAEMRSLFLANEHISPSRVHLLYPGIDFAAMDAKASAPTRFQSQIDTLLRPRIVHAAMLRPEKGHMLMLEVIAALHAAGRKCSYVVAGDGALRDAIIARAETLGLADHLVLTGMVDNVPALLQQSDILVMPSQYEPLGMAQIEALALSVPVVASRVGGIPETITDGVSGLLVSPDDKEAWCKALGAAIDDPGWMRRMARRGSADVRGRFAMSENLRQLLQHIDACRPESK